MDAVIAKVGAFGVFAALVGGVQGLAPVAPSAPPGALTEPERLVVLKETHLPDVPEMQVSPWMFRTWRQRATSFTSLAARTDDTNNVGAEGGEGPILISATFVSPNFFATLGVRPALGRDFAPGEDEPGHADVALLGHAFWQRRFGGRADALGKTLVLDGQRVTIVGVMPPAPGKDLEADVFRPLCYTPERWASRDAHVIDVVGRLKPGTSVVAARKEIAGISAEIAAAADGIRRRWGARAIPLPDYLAELAGPRVAPRGFDPAGASSVSVRFAKERYPAGSPRAALAQRLVDAVSRIPGVNGAGGSSALPLSADVWHNGFAIEGSPIPPTYPLGTTFSVTPGYFEVLRIPLVRGRLFDARDGAAATPVAIISERAAQRFPAGVDPLGKRIRLYGSERWLEVVGVVGEVSTGQYGRIEAQVYQPFAQQPLGQLSLVVRSDGARAALAEDVRAAVRGVDPAQPASELRPLAETLVERVAP
jgi:hypothetical protein